MTTITETQRVALIEAADALWSKHYAAVEGCANEDLSDYLYKQYNVIRDLVGNATIEASDTTPLWRDSDREDWMSDGSIHLELVADPSVTVAINPAPITSVMVWDDDDDEMVAVSPEHLPALIAMLQEMQRRIGGDK